MSSRALQYFRFVDIILQKRLQYWELWEIIKKNRLGFLIENINSAHSWPCFGAESHNNMLTGPTNMKYLVDSFEREVEKSGFQNESNDFD